MSIVNCQLDVSIYDWELFRILVAQAMNHRLVLISRDSAFDAYSIHPGDNLAIGKWDALWRGGGGVGE